MNAAMGSPEMTTVGCTVYKQHTAPARKMLGQRMVVCRKLNGKKGVHSR